TPTPTPEPTPTPTPEPPPALTPPPAVVAPVVPPLAGPGPEPGPAGTTPIAGPPSATTTTTAPPATTTTAPPRGVPNVTGQTTAAACQQVAAAGFRECRPDPVTAPPTPRPAPGTVFSQSPVAGVMATVETPIVIQVYAPTPVAVPAPAATDDYTTYCARVRTALLTCAPAATTANLGPFVGAIASVAPSAGSNAYPGDPVTVTSHTRTAVPRLVGSAPDDACTALTARKLTCTRDDKGAAPDASTPVMTVVSQSIAENAASDPATNAVTITFYATAFVPPTTTTTVPPPPTTVYDAPVPMYLLQHSSLQAVFTLAFGCPTSGGWSCVGQLATWWAPGSNHPPNALPVTKCSDTETGVDLFTVSGACQDPAYARFDNYQGVVAFAYNGPQPGTREVRRLCQNIAGSRHYLWETLDAVDRTVHGWQYCNESWWVP
ncbi:MAG TPA: PASTA domain-containing protein, partial [Acidimicrobiales bacterium]